jgi:hypothetical protein
MDPNATLARLRHMVESVQGGAYRESEAVANLDELTELVAALDGWLSRGGFLPSDWERVS